MVTATASVATGRPAIYLRQLCEHFADPGERHGDHEFDVAFEERDGFIDFAPVVSGTCRVDAREQGVLVLEATGADPAALERIQRIVAKHLERFGRDEALTVAWDPPRSGPVRGCRGLT